MKTRHSCTASVQLPAAPDKAFAALTHPRSIARWSGQKGKIQLKVGGKLALFDGWATGNVLQLKPGRVLSFTWRTDEWPTDAEESVVRMTFTRTATGTKISLRHSNLPNAKEARDHQSGWHEHIFEPLKEYLAEKRRKQPSPSSRRKS